MRTCSKTRCAHIGCARACFALLLLAAASSVRAESVFKCTDSRGGVAFQAATCASSVRQQAIDVRAQPLIDPHAVTPVSMVVLSERDSARHSRARLARTSSRRSAQAKKPSSYECRVSDGEVFYRHTRCPHAIPADGVARGSNNGESTRTRGSRGRGRARGAWGAVTVTSRKIPRGEACHQLDAVGAADRDGHARDEQVSVYEHLVGRDPCHGF